ncbi:tripartite tricarboxylate transporter substrate binding protein [Polaromonas sp.]|jgi:tripartite-type tricarboxylate transporter receptor subunit TctC|uniref:Bug family tripartite tricarboxylate transporter substrate binding protein n=1 Tax=Polaromonas sp. TaxID=1869339 RepID=UPI001D2E1783|nr:tripartite tricarboxylate transporter substrate binding protein [Polaromonas sp.]
MNARRTVLKTFSLPLLAGMLAMPALAQEDYPSRPVTMVVPFPPGGVADTVGRPVAEAMSRFLKQPVVVENKGGAGGGIGMGQVAKAKPDGYTVVMALSSFVVLPEADKLLKRTPMYQLDQLKPIARFTADPTVLVVRAESPWKTYAEFIAYVKSNPAKVSFGSSGNYGTMHVPMEQLKVATSSYMLHVPYTGAGPAVFALLAGQVDALSTGPASVLQQIKSGKLRALAHWGEGRLAVMPDVPSFKELGVPVVYSQWAGMFAPAATPAAVVEKLRQAAKFAAQDPRAVQALTAAGTSFQFQDAPDFERFVQTDARAMSSLVKRIGKVD